MLFTFLITALVACVIRPNFFPVAVLFVFEPLAFVTSAVSVLVVSVAMCFVVLPLAIINVAICVNQSAPSVCLIVPPVALVQRPIDPHLHPLSIFTPLPIELPFILSAIIQNLLDRSSNNRVLGLDAIIKIRESASYFNNVPARFFDLGIKHLPLIDMSAHSIRFETVLSFDVLARDHALKISLHCHSRVLNVLVLLIRSPIARAVHLSIVVKLVFVLSICRAARSHNLI